MCNSSFSNKNIKSIQKIALSGQLLPQIFFMISLNHIFLNINILLIHKMYLIFHNRTQTQHNIMIMEKDFIIQ